MNEGLFVLQLEFKHPTTRLLVTATFGPFESEGEASNWAEDASMDISWFTRIPLRMPVS